MSDLRARIADMIRVNGPMPVSLYMLTCLHDPREGYYATRPGFNEDFTTAPEISQVFGELLGLWAAHEWIRMGSPKPFWLIELGPGRGTMMADMLRAADSVTGFSDAAKVALVEASPTLRSMQIDTLAPRRVEHFDGLDKTPTGPSIIIANEFLDCMAIRQFVRDGNGWRERQVGVDVFGELDFGLGPHTAQLPQGVIPVGEGVEFAPALGTLVNGIAERFRQHPGRALLIDYGPDDRSPDDTLRSYRLGKQVDPLADPGRSDLTADVDFPASQEPSRGRGARRARPDPAGLFPQAPRRARTRAVSGAGQPRQGRRSARRHAQADGARGDGRALQGDLPRSQSASRRRRHAAARLLVQWSEHLMSDIPPSEEVPAIKRYSMHVRHGFFGRRGGVSSGVYKSLNCGPGSGDEPEKVIENRKRICVALGGKPDRLASPRQIHSAKAVATDVAFAPMDRPECDALVTKRPGLILGVLAADCAPILLCDPHNGVIAAIHAGWRGAVSGVIESTVEVMGQLGADPAKTVAGVGPCLSQASFEVGPDLIEDVLKITPWAEILFEPGSGDRQFFDLKRYAQARLARLGVSHIDALADDTLTAPDLYFSHRRAVKAGDRDCGRNMSAIMLIA